MIVHYPNCNSVTGFDPAEIKPLRAAGKIHLDTLNRIAAGLNVSAQLPVDYSDSPWKAYHGDYANQNVDFLMLLTSLLIIAPTMTLGRCSD